MAGIYLNETFYEPDTRLTWAQTIGMAGSAEFLVFGLPNACFVVIPKANINDVFHLLSTAEQSNLPMKLVDQEVWKPFYVKAIPLQEMSERREEIIRYLQKNTFAVLLRDGQPMAVISLDRTKIMA